MADLILTPGYLPKLASKQDEAANKAGEAASAADGIKTAVWVTHGVVSTASNLGFTAAGEARNAAGNTVRKAAATLAGKLRTADEIYADTDNHLGRNVNKQVLPD